MSSLASLAAGQTTVDLRTQSKDVDFSGASSTRPSKTGSQLPATCAPGEIFFQLNVVAGQNLYLCTALNTWTVTNGAGLPFATIATATMVSIVNGSNAAYGCNGIDNFVAPGNTTIVPRTGSSTELLLIGISCGDSHLKLIAPTNTLMCTPAGFAFCDSVAGNAFTDGIIPLASVVMMTNGAGSFTFGPETDLRAPVQDDPLTAGIGILYTKAGSTRAVAVDTTAVPLLNTSNDYAEVTASGAPAAGKERVYAKAGSGLCARDSGGNERCTVSGGGVGIMATPGQGSFIPYSLLNLTGGGTLQVSGVTTMRCAEFWTKVPYTLNLNWVVAQGQIADAMNYFGFAIYTSAGNRVTGATSTGEHVTTGMMSLALSGGPSLPATGDYLACWANNGSGVLSSPNDGGNYALYLNGNDPSGIPRTFDAGNPVSFSGATITWPATIGTRTAMIATPPGIALVP